MGIVTMFYLNFYRL